MPAELRPSRWNFPSAESADKHGVVAVGADLEPATLLRAYQAGLFPMPDHNLGTIAWWSPDPRGVLPLDRLVVSRSLARSCRRYEVSIDQDFAAVIGHCAHLPRHGAWITQEVIDAYVALHRLGWAHSVEAWEGDTLVGGLYGVAIGGFFAGESMFHTATDASKVALVGLVQQLRELGVALLDVQWATPHLETLGVIEISRAEYLKRLAPAVALDVSWGSPVPLIDLLLADTNHTEDHGADG